MVRAVISLVIFLALSSCVSPYREVGQLNIQVRLPQTSISTEPTKEEWYELIFAGGRSCASTFAWLKAAAEPHSTYLIEESLWSGDFRGIHTAYLLLYAKGYGGPDITLRGNPQVIPIDLNRNLQHGEWSEWMAPRLSEVSGNASWNLIYQTKYIRLEPLETRPLGEIRYQIIYSPNKTLQAIGDKSPQPER